MGALPQPTSAHPSAPVCFCSSSKCANRSHSVPHLDGLFSWPHHPGALKKRSNFSAQRPDSIALHVYVYGMCSIGGWACLACARRPPGALAPLDHGLDATAAQSQPSSTQVQVPALVLHCVCACGNAWGGVVLRKSEEKTTTRSDQRLLTHLANVARALAVPAAAATATTSLGRARLGLEARLGNRWAVF